MVTESITVEKYKEIMLRLLRSSYPWMSDSDFSEALDYSINKRYKSFNTVTYNNYTKKQIDMNILEMCDYIASREPIITSYGVMFKRHETVPNPMCKVMKSFMDLRSIHKKEMFKYPKGSEMFERFNLIQNLDKIDNNGCYGLLGLYVSIVYNINIAPSITSMGRSLISSAIMCFEMFLSNNVKFGSLNEILTFIDNVRMEAKDWKYDDRFVLDPDKFVTKEECFYKIMMTCGYKYIPDTEDLDIVWNIINNCNQTELNRLYYKNNLYNFMDNSRMRDLMKRILTGLNVPYMSVSKPPKSIIEPLNELRDYLLEYVFYCYQIIDRMDRNKNMIKNTSIISDTDSSFVSLDAWYHYCVDIVKGIDMPILHQNIDVIDFCEKLEKDTGEHIDPTYKELAVNFFKVDDFGDPVDTSIMDAITFEDPVLDYDFYNDEIIENNKAIDCCTFLPQDNLRFSIINVMAYVLDSVINQYMIDFTKQTHSYRGDENCMIIMKNEFFMYRVLMTEVKKHYAALQGVQEGTYLGKDGSLDVKGIDCMTKSVSADLTKKKLKKILLEDILKPDSVDQLNVIKKIAILERQIYTDVVSGSKKYYKPLTVKSANHYADPMREQGIKGSIAWNYIKEDSLPALDLRERNGVDIAKTHINITTIEKIKDDFPDHYERMKRLVDTSKPITIDGRSTKDIFKGNITSIAIPKDANVPKWILPLIDVETLISDNDANFPLESIGVSKLDSKPGITYTNMIKL